MKHLMAQDTQRESSVNKQLGHSIPAHLSLPAHVMDFLEKSHVMVL